MLSRFCISISNDSIKDHEKESVIEYENIEKTMIILFSFFISHYYGS